MEKVITKIAYSAVFYEDLKSIYSYGLETFGAIMAEILQDMILNHTAGLYLQYYFKSRVPPSRNQNSDLPKHYSWKVFDYIQDPSQ